MLSLCIKVVKKTSEAAILLGVFGAFIGYVCTIYPMERLSYALSPKVKKQKLKYASVTN
jgi:hypothetical protein